MLRSSGVRIPYPPALRNLVYRLYARRVEGRLDHDQVPKHIGVILDGNRRWARADGRTTVQGHQAGAEKISELLAGAPRPTSRSSRSGCCRRTTSTGPRRN